MRVSLTTVALLGSLLAIPAASAQSSALEQLSALESAQAQIEVRMQALRTDFVLRSDEIEAVRRKGKETTNPLTELRLQKLMQEAFAISQNLRQLETRKLELRQQIRLSTQTALEQIDRDLETVATQLKDADLPSSEKRRLTASFRTLLVQRDELHERYQPTLTLPTNLPLTPGDTESLESLEAKAALLGDLRDRLTQNLSQVRARLSQMNRQQVLLREARRFLDEESFFAETSFAKHAVGTNSSPLEKGIDSKTEAGDTASPQDNGAQPNGSIGDPLASGTQPVDGDPQIPATEELGPVLPESSLTLDPIRRIQLDAFVSRKGSDRSNLTNALEQLKQSEVLLKQQLNEVKNALALVESMARLSLPVEKAD